MGTSSRTSASESNKHKANNQQTKNILIISSISGLFLWIKVNKYLLMLYVYLYYFCTFVVPNWIEVQIMALKAFLIAMI